MQFATGPPLTGFLRHAGVSPLDADAPATFTAPKTLFATNSARFRARPPTEFYRHAPKLRAEFLVQVQSGWNSDPAPLKHEGCFANHPGGK